MRFIVLLGEIKIVGSIGLEIGIVITCSDGGREEGMMKVNSDAAVIQGSNFASCAAVMRDANEIWVAGFAKKLGRCNV